VLKVYEGFDHRATSVRKK